MKTLSILAALALGAIPAQAQTPAGSRPGTGAVNVEAVTQTGAVTPSKPVSKPKPKPSLTPEVAQPVDKLAASPKV